MDVRKCVDLLNTNEYNAEKLSKELGIPAKKFRRTLTNIGVKYQNKGDIGWKFEGDDEKVLERDIQEFIGTNSNKNQNGKNVNEQKPSGLSKQDVLSVLGLNEEELETLKMIHKEKQNNMDLLEKYKIYEDLQAKVPVDEEVVRRSYNFSRSTIEEFESFVKNYRVPKESIVELAIKNLVEQYNKL
ncbi:hypothetical protein U3A55_02385 [Salarchaeum sp. III]|uniref:hypothetical protein n=1 Tax=Salarchaeum sp. III TaxID=3107927 RepID=UPI002EDB774B